MSYPRTAQDSGSISAASSVRTWSGSFTQFATGATAYSAAPPETETPIAFHRSQRLLRPNRHIRHSWQYSDGSTATRSPTATSFTSDPISTTTPANSWPGITGSVGANSPWRMCRSVPHSPQADTSTTTSRGPAFGSGTSVTSSRPMPVITTAFT